MMLVVVLELYQMWARKELSNKTSKNKGEEGKEMDNNTFLVLVLLSSTTSLTFLVNYLLRKNMFLDTYLPSYHP